MCCEQILITPDLPLPPLERRNEDYGEAVCAPGDNLRTLFKGIGINVLIKALERKEVYLEKLGVLRRDQSEKLGVLKMVYLEKLEVQTIGKFKVNILNNEVCYV